MDSITLKNATRILRNFISVKRSVIRKRSEINKALRESELQEIVTFACTSAGLSTTSPGGISSVPEYETVLEML